MSRLVVVFFFVSLALSSTVHAELRLLGRGDGDSVAKSQGLEFLYTVPKEEVRTASSPQLFPDEIAAGLTVSETEETIIPSESVAIASDVAWRIVSGSLGDPSPTVRLVDAQAGPLAFQLLTVGAGGLEPGETAVISLATDAKSFGEVEVYSDENSVEFVQLAVSTPAAKKRKTSQSVLPPAPYRVRYTDGAKLRTVDTTESGAAPLLTHHGITVPVGGIEGSSLWFYAPRRHTLTDKHDSIFVDPASTTPSPAVATRPAFPTLSPQGVQIEQEQTVRVETNAFYERSVTLPLRERFVEYRLLGGQSKTITLSTNDTPTSTGVTATACIIGLTQDINVAPDHYAELSLCGAAVEQYSWDDRRVLEVDLASDTGNWPPTFSHYVYTVVGGPSLDAQNLDWIDFTYIGYPNLNSDGYRHFELDAASDDQPRLVTIGGLPSGSTNSDVILLDVTDPYSPVHIDSPSIFDAGGSVAVEFEAPATTCTLYLQSKASLPSPIPLEASPQLPALPSVALEGIYVCPSELQAALAPLMTHRGDGFIVLDPEAAYVAFDGGQESPTAIRDAVRHLFDSASVRASFPVICLVGHSTLDPRDFLGLQSTPQIPTWIQESINTGFTIENCMDYPYGLLYGDDDFLDAYLGRLAVRSAADLTALIPRIITRDLAESSLNASYLPALFVYDDDPNLLVDSAIWPYHWSGTGRGYDIVEVDILSDGTTERALIETRIEEGRSLVLYVGHGNNTIWADELIMRTADVANIDTTGTWPLVATFTCLNGYYAYPNGNPCMAETWSMEPTYGAGAMISASGADYYTPQKHLAQAALDLLSLPNATKPKRFGELLALAQIANALNYPDEEDTRHIYILFGDPAGTLALESDTTEVEQWLLLD